jgi:hypothetical protein
LSGRAVYTPPDFILSAREKTRVPHSDLKEITLEELSQHKEESSADGGGMWACALGYVVKLKRSVFFATSRGRDTTARNLMHFHGIPLDDNDNG